MKDFFVRFRIIVTGLWFLLGLLLTLVILFMSDAGDESTPFSVFEAVFLMDRSGVLNDYRCSFDYLVTRAPGMYATVFIPVLCTIPGIFAYFDEKTSGYEVFTSIRSTRKKKSAGRLGAQILASASMLMIAYAIYMLVIYIRQPLLKNYTDEYSVFVRANLKSYLPLRKLISYGLFGVFSATFAVNFCNLFNDRQLVIGTLFSVAYLYSAVIYRIMSYFSGKDDWDNYNVFFKWRLESLTSIINSPAVVITAFFTVSVLLSIIYIFTSIGKAGRK